MPTSANFSVPLEKGCSDAGFLFLGIHFNQNSSFAIARDSLGLSEGWAQFWGPHTFTHFLNASVFKKHNPLIMQGYIPFSMGRGLP